MDTILPRPGPDLTEYDLIVVNHSSGKDSQCQLDVVCTLARKAGVLDRVHMVHADLGAAEWPGVKELAAEHAAHYGIPCHVIARPQGDLLAHVRKRGMWPSSKQRYCTSDHKRGQVAVVITRLVAEWRDADPGPRRKARAHVLSCLGMRAQESPARAKLPAFQRDRRSSNRKKAVDLWLPIHGLTVAEVWARNKLAGTRPHPAYALGMPRLSCVFCIFANRAAHLIGGKHNIELLREYVRVEAEIGHDFKLGYKLADVLRDVEAGDVPDQAPDFRM